MQHRCFRQIRLLFFPYVCILTACVSRPKVPVEEIPVPSPARVPVVLIVPPVSLPAQPPPPESPRPIENFVRRVKDNDPALIRYFTQDEERRISIHAESDGFEVEYDLQNARPSPDGSRWELDFAVRETGSTESLQDTLWWNIDDDDSGILLSLDDDYQDQWLQYFDLFDRYGAKITFFTIGGFSPFCTEALNRGHDIGYHTMDHLNLLRVSQEVFFEQTLQEVESYRAAGIPLHSFAYPFGFSEAWMREALAGTFIVQRGFGVRYCIYDREAIKSGYIASVSIDNTVYKTDAEFENAITMMLRTVKFIGRGSIVPLTTHTIADDADWGITTRRLEYLLQSTRDLKLRFYRYGDF
ncbi:MAG: polysaccharide deacetylase family protein [Treponema sp.]|nr:polysaccharide deacetylase family protein [Treponema sp.]